MSAGGLVGQSGVMDTEPRMSTGGSQTAGGMPPILNNSSTTRTSGSFGLGGSNPFDLGSGKWHLLILTSRFPH